MAATVPCSTAALSLLGSSAFWQMIATMDLMLKQGQMIATMDLMLNQGQMIVTMDLMLNQGQMIATMDLMLNLGAYPLVPRNI